MNSIQRFEDLFRRDIDRLPLPTESRWTPREAPPHRPARWVLGASLAGAVAVGLVLGVGIASYRSHERVEVGSPAPIVAMPITRKEVIDQFSRPTAEAPTVTRVEAKLMTRAEFERAQLNGGSAGVDRAVWVWVVAVAGQVRPQFGHGTSFPSATYLVDANSGSVIGLNADNANWPTYFDSLPDHGAP
jgi:hypothetical protein